MPPRGVLPMGFCWALHWTQQAHRNLLVRAGLGGPDRVLLDRTPSVPPRPGEPARLVYVDNELLFISGSPQVAGAARIRASDSLGALGLPLREVVDHASIIECIGLELDGVKLQACLSAKRRWRLHQAWVALRRHPFLSGRQLEVLVGHLTHAMLLNRPALSCFRDVYGFTRWHYHTPRTLWPSVYDELRAAFALPLVLTVSRGTPWSSTVGCSDGRCSGMLCMKLNAICLW